MISLGTLIAFPIMLVLILATAIGSVLFFWCRRNENGVVDRDFLGASAILGAVCLGLIIGTAYGMYPYDAEYHTWRKKSGTVGAVDSRLLGQEKSTTQRFVVTFTDGEQRACDDTRCATVKRGDWLSLRCKRAWQYGATPGYDCNWVGNRPGGLR